MGNLIIFVMEMILKKNFNIYLLLSFYLMMNFSLSLFALILVSQFINILN